MHTKGAKIFAWLYALALVPVSLLIAWYLLVHTEFGYPLWYQVLAIDTHISEYAPQNLHGRDDFAATTQKEHIRLFSELLQAINGSAESAGQILEEVDYRTPTEGEDKPLLRAAEIAHLQDVANLVARLKVIGWLSTGLWLAAVIVCKVTGTDLPKRRHIGAALGAGGAIAGLGVAIIGPLKVFRKLHDWAFADGAQWFFYYQDSLLTTLTKAPDLFLGLAGLWLAVATAVYVGLDAGMRSLEKWHLGNAP